MLTLVAVGLVVAAAAAFRGTWSPCGLSMLSTVTPLAESGRGHRYRWTATWFFLGAVLQADQARFHFRVRTLRPTRTGRARRLGKADFPHYAVAWIGVRHPGQA